MGADVMIEDQRWSDAGLEALADRAVAAVGAHMGLGDLEVAILACDDARIAVLNAEFRGKEAPTNVLSWPSEERGADAPGGTPAPPEDAEIGDLAISFDTCAAEAAAQGKPFADHVTHLIVHGTLHLLGYDHVTDADGDLMEATEIAILGNLGLPDPYGTDDDTTSERKDGRY